MEFTLLISAIWLGILTSISPCPLATNIAAISFISKDIEHPFKTLLLGLLYTLGRVLSYVILAVIILRGLFEIPQIANFFQEYMNFILGPILIIVGIVLLGIFKISFNVGIDSNTAQNIAKQSSAWGAILLGMLFAVSFCPVSAALFFGSLVPLCVEGYSNFLLPLLYGAGTGLPVMVFAIVVAFSVNSVGKFYHKLQTFEKWMRKITGVIFIIVGIYYFAIYSLGV